MQRIALGIEYDGSGFCGWQMQSHGTRTVQGEVERALSIVADHPVRVTCAGRTDTGVHATAQVVHFDSRVDRGEKAWVMGTNAHLPDDVCVRWSSGVDAQFNARFSAVMRGYRYIILNRRARPALLHHRVAWIHHRLDADAMHTAAQALPGEHDFSSFRSSACQAEHARRFVESVTVHRQDDYIYVDVRANAFLHHMVRNIVGSLVVVGQGDRPAEWVEWLFHQRDRTEAGPTAAAQGLYLVAVEYPEPCGLPAAGRIPRYE